MCEEHLYFAVLASRWLDEVNFARGPAQFFKNLPLPLRLIVPGMIRRKVRETLKLQGFGRHTLAEQNQLAIADIDAIANFLGEKPFLMGERPCGADAAVFGFVAAHPSVRDPHTGRGGKAPKSCQLPQPHPAALFPGLNLAAAALFSRNKFAFRQLTDCDNRLRLKRANRGCPFRLKSRLFTIGRVIIRASTDIL